MNNSAIEFSILLLLGQSNNKISLLHLEKEMFLLWNSIPDIKNILVFIPSVSGPYSEELETVVKNPYYLRDYWKYIPPDNNDILSEGYVKPSPQCLIKYQRVYSNNGRLIHRFVEFKMVRELYDKLSFEEILLLMYDTYPEYWIKSDICENIHKSRKIIAEGLKNKGFITEERYQELIK